MRVCKHGLYTLDILHSSRPDPFYCLLVTGATCIKPLKAGLNRLSLPSRTEPVSLLSLAGRWRFGVAGVVMEQTTDNNHLSSRLSSTSHTHVPANNLF